MRHHDELTLDQLTSEQQQEIFAAFAPEEIMQIFGRGIRRRLAPMVQNDRPRIELIYSLAFSLPGIPLLRYGDEIGRGDDLSLQDEIACAHRCNGWISSTVVFQRQSRQCYLIL